MDERSRGDEASKTRASVMLRDNGAALARVCMALLGEAAAVERALEQIARDATSAGFDDAKSPLTCLMGLARSACANQLSRLPIRTTASLGIDEPPAAGTTEPGIARAALGRLKPTEREAVVLHLVGGLAAAQVAEACGTDLETARTRLARGIAQLVEQEKHR